MLTEVVTVSSEASRAANGNPCSGGSLKFSVVVVLSGSENL